MSVKIGRNDPCWCGSGKKYKACHQAFDERIAMIASQGHIVPTHDLIKNADQIAGIKESCGLKIIWVSLRIHIKMQIRKKNRNTFYVRSTGIWRGKQQRNLLFC